MSSTRFYLSEESIRNLGIPLNQVLILLTAYFKYSLGLSIIRHLRGEGLLDYKCVDSSGDIQGLEITQQGIDLVETVFLNSEFQEEKVDRIEALARKLQEIYPQGRKPGTNQYFRGNLREVILKLKKFIKLYGDYSDEVFINAVRKYVESFNGDYTYMRTLPYLILKYVTKYDSEGVGHREEISDLASYIENAGQEEALNNDWTSTLV